MDLKVHSKEGAEKLGTVVATKKTLFSVLNVYMKETELQYSFRSVEYMRFSTIALNYILGIILSVVPIHDIKEVAKELRSSKELSKKNITTGKAFGFRTYEKSKYTKKSAIRSYTNRINELFEIRLKIKNKI